MERRFILFVTLSILVVLGWTQLWQTLNPPPPAEKPPAVAQRENAPGPKPGDKRAAAAEPKKVATAAEKSPLPATIKAAPKPAAGTEKPEKAFPDQWAAIGSVDPKSPFRMLVTLTNRGAAVERIELSSPKYRDLEDRSGYLGHLGKEEDRLGDGCRVDVVGAGTPAAEAGLRPGDIIKQINQTPVISGRMLNDVLHRLRPGQPVTLVVARGGRTLTLGPVALGRRPLEVIRPEPNDAGTKDPLSFLTTLYQVGDQTLPGEEKSPSEHRELPGVAMRDVPWELLSADAEQATFRKELPRYALEVIKTYRLEKVPPKDIGNADCKAYHLVLDISISNTGKPGSAVRKVAYQLDGPTGLPIEGYWYANKVARSWGAGIRDVVVSFNGKTPTMVDCPTIADDKTAPAWQGEPLTYIGVDAQYFSVVMIPQVPNPQEVWFAQSQPLRVGKVDPNWKKRTDTSCRLVSVPRELKPGGEPLKHSFVVFAGPKRPELLAQYGLDSLVYYGWFDWIARYFLVVILDFFYTVFRNYGIAIILLTVLVRGALFHFSRKQALSTLKMAELQPEIKRIQEKYKGNAKARTEAQQELFRKHNYNPLGGCLVVFVQLPIFVALYNSLRVDVELRQAPLITDAIRWCSNLAAPDMLFDWSSFMPDLIVHSPSMFGLGPYLNVLPLVTIGLFLWQQKKMMPPPADEQAAMQQKVMKYMMIFMGIMFFKVPSGLCIYFIASTLWGIGERHFLPKAAQPGAAPAPAGPPQPGLWSRLTKAGNGQAGRGKNRKRSRRQP
jgi:YidC/Oxa1 family membrane protein insertase